MMMLDRIHVLLVMKGSHNNRLTMHFVHISLLVGKGGYCKSFRSGEFAAGNASYKNIYSHQICSGELLTYCCVTRVSLALGKGSRCFYLFVS